MDTINLFPIRNAPGVKGTFCFYDGIVDVRLLIADSAPAYTLKVINGDGTNYEETPELIPDGFYQGQFPAPDPDNCQVVLEERWPGGDGRIRWSKNCDPDKW